VERERERGGIWVELGINRVRERERRRDGGREGVMERGTEG
jgi:hypothetical protein